jgi:hypothetical protein
MNTQALLLAIFTNGVVLGTVSIVAIALGRIPPTSKYPPGDSEPEPLNSKQNKPRPRKSSGSRGASSKKRA